MRKTIISFCLVLNRFISAVFISVALLLTSCGQQSDFLNSTSPSPEKSSTSPSPEISSTSPSPEISSIIGLDEQIDQYAAGETEIAVNDQTVPGVYNKTSQRVSLSEVITAYFLFRYTDEAVYAYGNGFNSVTNKYEHHVAIVRDEGNQDIKLSEMDEHYMVSDMQAGNNILSLLVYRTADRTNEEDTEADDSQELELWLYDYSGNRLLRTTTGELLGTEGNPPKSLSLIQKRNGLPWILDYRTGRLTSFDENGSVSHSLICPVQRIYEICIEEDTVYYAAVSENNKLLLLSSDYSGNILVQEEMDIPGLSGVYFGTEGNLYLMNEKSLYRASIQSNVVLELFKFTSYGIDYQKVRGVREKENGEYEILAAEYPSDTVETCLLTPYKDVDSEEGRITVACLQSTELLRYAVNMMNESSEGMRIDIKEYYDSFQKDASMEDALRRLNADIFDGTAGDIVCFTGLENLYSRENYAAAGVFEDLYEIMNADPDFHKEKYLTHIWQLNEIDGELINLVPLFSLRAFISAKRNSEILSGLKDKILEESVSLRYVCGRGYIREEYLHDLCIYLLNDASSEDSILYQPEKLAALLKAGSSLEKEDPSGGEDDFVNIHLGKELLFNTYGHYTFPMGRFLNQYRLASGFFNPEDFKEDWFTKAGYDNITDVVNGWSEPVELTGFPLGETGAFSVQNSLSLGILKGKNTEAAWKFLKSTLEGTFQEGNRTYMYETIPVNRAVYYGLLERITENNQLDPLYLFMSGSGLYDHSGSALAPAPLLTEEMLKAVEMNINECRYIAEADPFVKQIVAEEAERFYEGSYDALSAAERIGERVRLYRSEQEY